MQPSDKKPTLLQLREKYHLSILDVSWAGEVDTFVVWQAFVNREGIKRSQAKKVLYGVNRLANTHYTLEEVNIKIAD